MTVSAEETEAPVGSVAVNRTISVEPPASTGARSVTTEPAMVAPTGLESSEKRNGSSSGSSTSDARSKGMDEPASISTEPAMAVGGRLSGGATTTITEPETR